MLAPKKKIEEDAAPSGPTTTTADVAVYAPKVGETVKRNYDTSFMSKMKKKLRPTNNRAAVEPERQVDESVSLSKAELAALDQLKHDTENKITLAKGQSDLVNTYFDLCQRGLCSWNFNDDGTVTFTLD